MSLCAVLLVKLQLFGLFGGKVLSLALQKCLIGNTILAFFEISRLEDTTKSREMVPLNSSFNTTKTISSEWKVTMQKLSILL